MLEKARRIWKQLLLSEDAMLIYRVTRAPERRIFKIFVGNIDEKDVPAYVNNIANNFKRSPVIDQNTGQVDTRYNQMAQDQDYFIPVRDTNAPSPIETLPGASNLSEIADIQYLQKKLFTALRVPKPFLGFEEVNGEGKNLALQDIRFARTINRIQQAMIQELNKIAIIHLYILGLEDELENFTLTLNNPSTQAEMLKVEQTQLKVTLYKDVVSDAGNGFGTMSMTRAKKEILGMSEEEIRNDLEQQRLEKAAAAEMEQTATIIKKTGIFDRVDKLYGDFSTLTGGVPAEGGGEEGEGTGGDDLGGFGTDTGGDLGGIGTDTGGAEPAPTEESIKKKDNLLLEQGRRRYEEKVNKYQRIYLNRLMESLDKDERVFNLDEVEKDTEILNSKISDMAKEIDNLIK
jgi:pyrimidine operon attenuation protein/uracil phosphoribosyltransferase